MIRRPRGSTYEVFFYSKQKLTAGSPVVLLYETGDAVKIGVTATISRHVPRLRAQLPDVVSTASERRRRTDAGRAHRVESIVSEDRIELRLSSSLFFFNLSHLVVTHIRRHTAGSFFPHLLPSVCAYLRLPTELQIFVSKGKQMKKKLTAMGFKFRNQLKQRSRVNPTRLLVGSSDIYFGLELRWWRLEWLTLQCIQWLSISPSKNRFWPIKTPLLDFWFCARSGSRVTKVLFNLKKPGANVRCRT